MSLPLGCAHQLPRIGPQATASARLGTDPRPDSRTTPLVFTNARASLGVIPESVLVIAGAASGYVPRGSIESMGTGDDDGGVVRGCGVDDPIYDYLRTETFIPHPCFAGMGRLRQQ